MSFEIKNVECNKAFLIRNRTMKKEKCHEYFHGIFFFNHSKNTMAMKRLN
jgi:hypothetical protein